MKFPPLPDSVIRKASTPEHEPAWRMPDVEEALEAARQAKLACLGGQPQFRLLDGTCEAYWLDYDPAERHPDETWASFVDRTAHETLIRFRKICQETDFREEAKTWSFLFQKMETEAYDPIADLWFILCFVAEAEYLELGRDAD